MSKSFDDYIDEMMQMYRETAKKHIENEEEPKAVFAAESVKIPVGQNLNEEKQPLFKDASGSGRLTVKVTTARGMLPVEGAAVTVSQTPQNGGAKIITLETDQSGTAAEIELPAPPRYKSESPLPPDDDEEVMAKYDIFVSAEGYADAVIKNAAVFDGVTSIQNVDMLTASAVSGGERE